jgi:hypothetical protein
LIFNFADNIVKTESGDIFPCSFNGKEIVINEPASVITIKIDQYSIYGDSIVLKINGRNTTFIDIKSVQSGTGLADHEPVTMGRNFFINYTPSLKFYLDFLDQNRMIITSVNLTTGDTISEIKKWQITTIDSLKILRFNDSFCRFMFLIRSTASEVDVVDVSDSKLTSLRMAKVVEEDNRIRPIVNKLIGLWRLDDNSFSNFGSQISSLKITEDSVIINPNSMFKKPGRWYINSLLNFVVLDVPGSAEEIDIKKVNDDIRLYLDGRPFKKEILK